LAPTLNVEGLTDGWINRRLEAGAARGRIIFVHQPVPAGHRMPQTKVHHLREFDSFAV
jgi:hypothetical protein